MLSVRKFDAPETFEIIDVFSFPVLDFTDFSRQEAQTFKIDNDSGLFNPDVLRQATLNQVIEDQLYPRIETEAEEQGAEPDEDDMETQLQREQLNQNEARRIRWAARGKIATSTAARSGGTMTR